MTKIQLEPYFQDVIKKEPPPGFILTPEALRQLFVADSSDPKLIQQLPKVIETIHTISTSAGNDIRLTITRPPGTEITKLPVIIFIHGGGWVIGNEITSLRPRTELAVAAHAAIVFVHYSLAPEKRYPIALEECYDAVVWTAKNASSMNMDATKLVVAGDSAGGNLAAAITLLAKQRQFAGIRGQILFYPVMDANFNTDSYNKFATGYDLTREMMQWCWDHYVDEKDRHEITASPLKATLSELQGLPPALIISCEADVLLDEGEEYARKLLAAGVDVSAVRIQGTLHGFLDMQFFGNRAAEIGLGLAVGFLQRLWKE